MRDLDARVGLDLAVLDREDAIAGLGDARVVGDEDHGEATGALFFKEEFEDARTCGRVQVAGGLIGDENRWVEEQCAGDRDALLLTAREL